MKTFCLVLFIGSSCLVAQAADDIKKPSPSTVPALAPAVETTPPSLPPTPSIMPGGVPVPLSPTPLNPAPGVPLVGLNPPVAPFKDKIVRIEASVGNHSETFTLENVSVTPLLGSPFLIGTAVKHDRYSGLEIYLNLRDVHTIIALTAEQATKFMPPGGPFVPSPGPTVPQGPPPPGDNLPPTPQQPILLPQS